MKQFFTITAALVALNVSPLPAQAPPADGQQVLALVKEVMAQQGQISENQTKIETKVTEIAEIIRLARIYSSRSGK